MVSDPKAICDPSFLEEHERIIEFVQEMVRSAHSSYDLLFVVLRTQDAGVAVFVPAPQSWKRNGVGSYYASCLVPG
jgi:hypothetical protein